MKIFAVFDKTTGLATAFYNDDVYPDVVTYETPEATEDDPDPQPVEVSRERHPFIPEGVTEITEADWLEILSDQQHRRWNFETGAVEAFTPDLPPAPEPVTVVYKVDFYDRMTEAEAEQVEGVISQQSVKQRRIFESAGSFRSDHELWGLLEGLATGLFGAARAGELLAPSE